MRFIVILSAATGVASVAIAPPLSPLNHEATRLAEVGDSDPAPPPSVDETSTKKQWVSSYEYKNKFEWGHSSHWLPAGPNYLDMDTLEKGYYAHLIEMHGSKSWLSSGVLGIKRFLTGSVTV